MKNYFSFHHLPIGLLIHSPASIGLAAKPVGRLLARMFKDRRSTQEYRLGRYVDGHDPLVMHEGHPVYRVETSAHWIFDRTTSHPCRDGTSCNRKRFR